MARTKAINKTARDWKYAEALETLDHEIDYLERRLDEAEKNKESLLEDWQDSIIEHSPLVMGAVINLREDEIEPGWPEGRYRMIGFHIDEDDPHLPPELVLQKLKPGRSQKPAGRKSMYYVPECKIIEIVRRMG